MIHEGLLPVSTVDPPCRDCSDRGRPRPPLSLTLSSLAMVNRTKANWTMLAMIWVWQASSQMCAAVKLEFAGTLASTEIPANGHMVSELMRVKV